MQERDEPRSRSFDGKMTLLLALASGVIRVLAANVNHMANITPLGPLSTFSGSRLRSWFAVFVPLTVMVVSDALLNVLYGKKAFDPFVYACYGLNVFWGWLFIRRITPVRVGGVALLASVQFFLITNFGVWLGSEGLVGQYEKSLAGLMLCYTEGIPFFFRTLTGELGYSALFFGLYVWITSAQRASAAAKETA